MTDPIPVPSECFDLTPSDLWPAYWSCYPQGTEMPPCVPKPIWEKNWRKRNPDRNQKGEQPPPPPVFLRGYWGRFNHKALTSRRPTKKQKTGSPTDEPPERVLPPRLSDEFWKKYFEIFPNGHNAPPQSSGPYTPYNPANEPPPRYAFINRQLCVNVSSRPDCPVWRPSTGVDSWDDRGNWTGGC